MRRAICIILSILLVGQITTWANTDSETGLWYRETDFDTWDNLNVQQVDIINGSYLTDATLYRGVGGKSLRLTDAGDGVSGYLYMYTRASSGLFESSSAASANYNVKFVDYSYYIYISELGASGSTNIWIDTLNLGSSDSSPGTIKIKENGAVIVGSNNTGVYVSECKWHKISRYIDLEHDKLHYFIDGKEIYSRSGVAITGVRSSKTEIPKEAAYGGNIYIDDIGIYTKASNLFIESDAYIVKKNLIHGYAGMTVGDLIAKSQIPEKAEIKVLKPDKLTEAEPDSDARPGMILRLISAEQSIFSDYILDAEHFVLSDIKSFVNDERVSGVFFDGTVSVRADIFNYTDIPAEVFTVIGHYNKYGKLIDVDMSKSYAKCGSSVLDASIEINTTADTYIKAFVVDASTLCPLTCPVLLNPASYDEFDKIINITDETVYAKDNKYHEQLKNRVAFHIRSGVMYKNGKKNRMNPMPYTENGEVFAPVEAVEWLFDANVDIQSGQIVSGQGTCSIKELLTEKDNELYLPVIDVAKKVFSYDVYTDETTVSSGMVVIGENVFYPPPAGSEELQALNDFIFYYRPKPEEILDDYKSSSSFGVHPRIMLTPKDAEQIKNEIKTNEVKKAWFERLISKCDILVKTPALSYEFRDGVRLMYVADDFENYMLMLGMAYQLTSDKKYSEAAWRQIEAVSSFPDWNPAHHIDVGIMAVGYAVAYDWMYDCWSDEQKEIMQKAIYNHCFYVANESYKGTPEGMGGVINQQNHNVICNGGISMSALAFIDVYPEISAKLVSDATRCLEYMIHNFAPYGAWYEGPSYAGMTIDYTVRMLSAYDTALNNLYCMDMVEGINLAGEYLTYVQSDVSCFNFADAEYGYSSSAGLFWLFDYFDMKGMKEPLRMTKRYTTNYDDSLVHCLQWYSTEEESDVKSFGLDKRYEGTEIITMRNTYDEGQVFVGIKAGDTVYDHSHLDSGSFVFDALGVRWAHDMGKDDYNLSGYFGMDGPRWNIFRMRSESHNTIAINPGKSPNYVIGARADVLSFEQKPGGTITKIDMSKVLADNVTEAKRGFLFTNNRTTLVVRDEINLKKESDVYWFMYTKADAEINGTSVILTDRDDKSKQITIDFALSHPGEVYFEAATPLETCPKVSGQLQNDGFYRVVYKMKASGNAHITAKLTPSGYPTDNIQKYNTDIDSWEIEHVIAQS